MIVGLGTDVVDVARLGRALERTPALAMRVFTEAERDLPLASLAVRFAAKEAVAKALGSPPGLGFLQAEVVTREHGRPTLRVTGEAARLAASMGVTRWHVSLSHDGGVAVATVIAEGDDPASDGGEADDSEEE